jgi:hypothetical protein
MTTPEFFLNSDGKEFVLIRHSHDDGFTTMPKAVWDELEAVKENGTIS